AYHYAERSHKLINARQHGARALLLVTHPAVATDDLPALRGVSQPLGIVALAIRRATADALLRPSGKTIAEQAAAIDGATAPRSGRRAARRAGSCSSHSAARRWDCSAPRTTCDSRRSRSTRLLSC